MISEGPAEFEESILGKPNFFGPFPANMSLASTWKVNLLSVARVFQAV